ncbi:blastoderm-specific protein 25D [Aricia agestis]|uniref:blastoderm-specific protein 25D n=1 Tax=Aricia agestis TaxID=91739 RepID=UPI001C204145|nr:blastoderm-specific protein 25D [Aricia agestis]
MTNVIYSHEMDGASMNQYEKQLYSVFKTFDVDNDEALDRSAVLELCDTLQLENRGTTLVDSLFEKKTDRVTFAQFRNGLLTVLGNETPSKSDQFESSTNITSANSSQVSPTHSDEDSSGREVAPKFVFGSKKYGRKSRPQRTTSEDSPRHRGSSESRLCERTKQRMKCKRSSSAMENRTSCYLNEETLDLDHNKRVDRQHALSLCHRLNMSSVEQNLIDRIFESSSTDELTIGEFFDKLNSSLTTSIVSLNENEMDTCNTDGSLIPVDTIVEAWEQAGVQKPRRLLFELGFVATAVQPGELEQALDHELRALNISSDMQNAHSILLAAANSLACLRLDIIRQQYGIVKAERDKLHIDLGEANRRARMLAQDVDENHARIEEELKTNLKLMEAKHAEAIKMLSLEVSSEKEKAASAKKAFGEELAKHTEIESRLQMEIENLHSRNEQLQEKVRVAESRANQAEKDKTRLVADIRQAEENGAAAVERERASSEELAIRLHELRLENQRLRDINDELNAELENPSKIKNSGCGIVSTSWLDESGLNDIPVSPKNSIDMEVNNPVQFAIDQVFDPSTLITKLLDTVESIHKIPLLRNGSCHFCVLRNNSIRNLLDTLRELSKKPVSEWLTTEKINTRTEVALQTESAETEDTVKNNLPELSQQHEIEKQNLTAVIRELETSLEQMRTEYEKCEEYWSNKIEEERAAHAEEQKAGDERLAELCREIADYEHQFARLPPIDERANLELQVAQLEQEVADYRAERDAEVAAKDEELKALKSKVEELERSLSSRPAPAPVRPAPTPRPPMLRCAELEGQLRRQAQDTQQTIAGCQCAGACGWALRARAVRAERAAQRLHARLAATDLIVKDLFIENCRLAHRPHRL